MAQTIASAQSHPASDEPLRQPKPKFNPRILLLVGVLAGAGYWGWRHYTQPTQAPILHISGRIEADETDIGAKTGGRVIAIHVKEGDLVKTGQVIAEIEDPEINAQLSGAIAQVNAAQQDAAQAKLDIQVAESRIQESVTNVEQAKGDSLGRMNQATSAMSATKAQLTLAEAQVQQAQAQIKLATAELQLAQRDRNRFNQLVQEGAINRQQYDQSVTKVETAQANLDNAKAGLTVRLAAVQAAADQVTAAEGSLTQVASTQLNPTIRSSQLLALQQQKQQAYAKLAAAEAKVQNALANQQQIQKRLESFKVKSPINGVVQARPVEPGAVVATGKILLTVLDPKAVYLRAYVPEGDLSKIYVGKPARILLDSASKQALQAKIQSIDPKASFTPENIYFQKDRVRQVFGVKLSIEQDHEYAKPGMPADAEIDL